MSVTPNVELTGAPRRVARAVRRSMDQGAARPWMHAVGCPVECLVRHRLVEVGLHDRRAVAADDTVPGASRQDGLPLHLPPRGGSPGSDRAAQRAGAKRQPLLTKTQRLRVRVTRRAAPLR